MKLLAISGWKGSGKDMCAEYLVNNYGFTRLAFADVLKARVAQQYSIPLSRFSDPKYKEKAILSMPVSPRDTFSEQIAKVLTKEFDHFEEQPYWTPRTLCILEGSVKKSVDPDYWVKLVISQAQKGNKYVISDLRYVNEAESLKKIAKIDHLLIVRIKRWGDSPSEDPSERDLDSYTFDAIINNADVEQVTKEMVYRQLDSLVEVVK